MNQKENETPDNELSPKKALISHVAPYLLWVSFIIYFQVLDSVGITYSRDVYAFSYTLKSLLCLGLFLLYKPWQYYTKVFNCFFKKCPLALNCKGILLGIWTGLLVAFVWILPESDFIRTNYKPFYDFYNKWFIFPLGGLPEYYNGEFFRVQSLLSYSYSPNEGGWLITITKLLGSAFVIAVIEEYFFRGFIYRWITNNNFVKVDLAKFDKTAFWIVVLLFALEHDRFIAGVFAGLIYGFLTIKTGSLTSSIVSHVTTNLVLGIYVIIFSKYGFW